MLTFTESKTINAGIGHVWSIVSDVANWSAWDPHVEKSRFDGDFAPGGKGWTKPKGAPAGTFEVTDVDLQRGYSTCSAMPGGKMLIINTYRPVDAAHVVVTRTVEIYGPFVPLFRLIWAKGMRADIRSSFAALEAEAKRLVGESAGALAD